MIFLIVRKGKGLGFVKARSKQNAIAQALHSLPYPHKELKAKSRAEVKDWEIQQHLLSFFSRYCEAPGCLNQLGKNNKHGFCQIHTELAPHRKSRKPAQYRNTSIKALQSGENDKAIQLIKDLDVD